MSRFERSPLSGPGSWRRTALHCHSLRSDGGLEPAETVAVYRSLGYDCVALTDHGMVTDVAPLSEGGFVTINSTENGGVPDIIGIGVASALPRDLPLAERATGLAEQGGLTIAAHPHYSAATVDDYMACEDLMAIEILNAYCDQAYANGRATEVWDLVLGQGKRVWGIAADDAHLNPAKRYFSRAGQAWVEVWTPDLSRDGIVSALKSGAFVATEGPRFAAIELEGTRPRLTCSPVAEVRWRTHGRVGFVDHAPLGGSITNSQLPDWFEPSVFMRIELVDHQGKRAWSNPFFVV